MAAPTKEAIIGTFINGRNAQDDFLQLATNHGGTVFGWIDYLGHLQGSLADGIVDLTAGQVGFGSSTNTVIGDPGFLYDQSTQVVTIGSPISDFSPIVPTERGHLNVFEANTGEMGILSLVQDDGTLTGAGITQLNEFFSLESAAVPATQVIGLANTLLTTHTGTTLSACGFKSVALTYSAGDVGELNGIEGYAFADQGTGLVTWLSSIRAAASTPLATGNQTVNNAAVYIEGPNTGAVNTYSLYMEGPDSPTDPNTFAIFSAAGVNHFEGTATATPVEVANSTAATGGANQSSPFLAIKGTYWTGSASAADTWQIQNVPGTGANPSVDLAFTHSGSATKPVVRVPDGNLGAKAILIGASGGGDASALNILSSAATAGHTIVLPPSTPANSNATLVADGNNPTAWTYLDLGLTVTLGFGNGSAGTAVTTTTKNTGSGPTTPQTIVQYLEVVVSGATYWIPLVQ